MSVAHIKTMSLAIADLTLFNSFVPTAENPGMSVILMVAETCEPFNQFCFLPVILNFLLISSAFN